jgi:hypothetical protein
MMPAPLLTRDLPILTELERKVLWLASCAAALRHRQRARRPSGDAGVARRGGGPSGAAARRGLIAPFPEVDIAA